MDLPKIKQILEEAPSHIARYAELAELQKVKSLQKKEDIKRKEAYLYLTTKANNPDFTVAQLNHCVSDNKNLFLLKIELINVESEQRKQENKINLWDNKFTGAKVLARLEMAQMSNLGG